MSPRAYKFFTTHDHGISGRKITSIHIRERTPNFGGVDGGVQSDQSTLAFKKLEQLEDFNIIITCLK